MSRHANVQLRQQRGQIIADMHKLLDGAKGDRLTSEQAEKFNRMDAEARSLGLQIEAMESSFGLPPEQSHMFNPGRATAKTGYERSYDAYLRHGFEGLNEADRSALGEKRASVGLEGTPTGGAYPGSTAGFIVPVGFVNKVEAAMKFAGDMLAPDFCQIVSTELGGPLPFPTSDDTANVAEIVSEANPAAVQDVPTGIVNLGSYRYSTKVVKVSYEVMQDTTIDVQNFLAETFGNRLGRKLNSDFLVGTGSGMPTGVVTAAVAASGPTYTAIGSSSNDGSGAANTIGSDDLVGLMNALDVAYRPRASFLMHPSTLASLQMLKDKYGRPIFQPGLSVGAPDTLMGHRYFLNPYMDTLQTTASSPAATKTTMLFGDFSRFVIRRVLDLSIVRLNELYAVNAQVGFIGYARYDSNLIDGKAIARMFNTY